VVQSLLKGLHTATLAGSWVRTLKSEIHAIVPTPLCLPHEFTNDTVKGMPVMRNVHLNKRLMLHTHPVLMTVSVSLPKSIDGGGSMLVSIRVACTTTNII